MTFALDPALHTKHPVKFPAILIITQSLSQPHSQSLSHLLSHSHLSHIHKQSYSHFSHIHNTFILTSQSHSQYTHTHISVTLTVRLYSHLSRIRNPCHTHISVTFMLHSYNSITFTLHLCSHLSQCHITAALTPQSRSHYNYTKIPVTFTLL